jgi:iron(III) transport system permease protein
MSVGVVWAILGGLPGVKGLYGTLYLMALVLTLEAIPTGMRVMNAGMVQLSAELEEAARVSGASWLRTMWKVVIPLMAPTIVSAWLLGFLGSIRSLVILLFIYVPATKVMSVHIFELWNSDRQERAAVLGLMLTVLCVLVAVIAQYLAHRVRRSLEVPVA